MKNILANISFLVVMAFQCVAGANILGLTLDSATYSVGQKSLIRAYISTKSNNPDDEIIFSSKLNGQDQEVLSLDSRIGFGLSNYLMLEGAHEWRVEAFVQNKKKVERYEKVILSYTNENVELSQMIADEVDLEQKSILQEIFDRNLNIIANAENAITEQRRKIAEEVVYFQVSESKSPGFLSSLFSIEMNQEDRTYSIGEVASFTAQLLSDVAGSNGIHEVMMEASVEAAGSSPAILLSRTKISERAYRFTSPALTNADVGVRRLKVDVKTRPKFQADAIREAMKFAKLREGALQGQITKENDALTKTYLDLKRQVLTPFITNLNGHLSEIIEPLLNNQGARFDVVL